MITPAYFIPAIPEIFLLVMGCATLLLGVFIKRHGAALSYYLVQLSLLVSAALVLCVSHHKIITTFNDLFILDNFAVLLKVVIAIISFVVLVYSREYVRIRMPAYQVEYYVLALFSVLGMMVLVSANNLLSLFLGLELFSLPVYAMVALRRDVEVCTEAAMKYFIMGAIASGILLYGMSMLYGATQTLDIPAIANVIAHTPVSQQLILVFGMVFVVVGVAFKLGAVPFHMWVPDVYEGAPSSVTLFITSAPKVAAVGMAIRLLVDAMPGLSMEWQQLLVMIALLSMAVGNLAAIVQTNIKRMLAYSSIAHMGYMTLGLLAATPEGYAAATFYIISYAIMSLIAFGMILIISKAGFEAEKIEDFQGLNTRNPGLAFLMLLVMFSMAGIPPLVGFMAKIAVLNALIVVHQLWLAVVALLFAIIGAYYYLKVVKVMYFEEPQIKEPVSWGWGSKLTLTLNGLVILGLGLSPGLLFNICRNVF